MLNEINKSLTKRLAILEIEYEIQRDEAELSYNKKKTRILEEVIREQQHILSRLKRIEIENCLGGDMK